MGNTTMSGASRWIRLFAAVILGVALIASGCSKSKPKANAGSPVQKLPYDLEKKQVVEAKHYFDFSCDTGVDLKAYIKTGDTKYDMEISDPSRLAQVYADPGLTQVVPSEIYVDSITPNKFTVVPPSGNMMAENADIDQEKLMEQNRANGLSRDEMKKQMYTYLAPNQEWGGVQTFYLARYVGADGKKLARPVVTPFSVQGKTFPVAAPTSVKIGLASNGGLNISWSAVKDATGYEVYLKTVGGGEARVFDPNNVMFTRIGTTTKTSLNTQAVDANSEANKASASDLYWNVMDQNAQFRRVAAKSEDELMSSRSFENNGANVNAENLRDFSTADNAKASIAVVAVKDEARSTLVFTDVTSYMAQLPLREATYARLEQLKALRKQYNLDELARDLRLYTTLPVTMADGHTAMVPIVYDVARATIKPSLNKDGTNTVYLPYHALNTKLGDTLFLTETPSWKKDVAAQQKKNLATQTKAGGLPQFAYSKAVDWTKYKNPQTQIASVPYPVNGTSDFVKFLASNMIAGNRYLDITAYVNKPGAPEASDALDEAVSQNPYILYSSASISTIKQNGKTLAVINYPFTIKNWSDEQKQLWDKVQSIDKQIIKASMSNEQKARAIDSYLAQHSAYDWAAFNASQSLQANNKWNSESADKYYATYPTAHNACGALLSGKGVCASYAFAFKALADQAGLPCMYVTGTVRSNSNSHAWNKVQLTDSTWLIVDSTWNDTGGSSDRRYFGLKDSDPKADRVQDNDFVVDAYLGQYAN